MRNTKMDTLLDGKDLLHEAYKSSICTGKCMVQAIFVLHVEDRGPAEVSPAEKQSRESLDAPGHVPQKPTTPTPRALQDGIGDQDQDH